jgi:translation initiation factor IF-1
MGSYEALMIRGQGPDARGQDEVKSQESGSGEEATVIDLLPSASYRLKLANEDLVIAHAAGAGVRNFERLRPGDKVRVEISPHDRTRGRIVELLR